MTSEDKTDLETDRRTLRISLIAEKQFVPIRISIAIADLTRGHRGGRQHRRLPRAAKTLAPPLEISSPSDPKFAHKKLETLRYHMITTNNPESLPHLNLNWYHVVTNGRTDRQNYDSENALSTTCSGVARNLIWVGINVN